ncbi:GNAT family N-acetyltransferase [Staphylococcus hominis]|uniref:GNAT family N-acetyltransferase n=1 Tax=Staphylococcus hominis TaxID=1290 RepID=UPI003F649CCE
MNIELYSEYNEKYLNDIYQIYNSVGWANHNKNNINEIFNNSTFVTLASYNDKIIGFARALSDGVFNAAIYDLVVKKNFNLNILAFKYLTIFLHKLVLYPVFI